MDRGIKVLEMKDKICNLCKTSIDTEKEYCQFVQFKKKDIIQSKAYYHVNCFRDRLNSSKAQKDALKKASDTLEFARKKLGIEENKKEEVVYIN